MRTKDLEAMAQAYAEVQEKARQEAAQRQAEYYHDKGSKADIVMDPKKKKKEDKAIETDISTQESTKFMIPEEIPANERTAFHGAAAGAAKAGKSHFMFKGKKYPATMQKDTAQAITSDTQKEEVDLDEAKNHGNMDNGSPRGEGLSPSAKKELARKTEAPAAVDIDKVLDMDFKTFKAMGKKSKSRPGDNAKGDNNIIKSATPVKEEALDELSTDTLKRYHKKAGKDAQHASDKAYDDEDKEDLYLDRVDRRDKGIETARSKLKSRGVEPPKLPHEKPDFDPQRLKTQKPVKVAGREKKNEEVELDELSIDTLKSYDDKAYKDQKKVKGWLRKNMFPSKKRGDSAYKIKKFDKLLKKNVNRAQGQDRAWKKLVDKGAYPGRKPGEYGIKVVDKNKKG